MRTDNVWASCQALYTHKTVTSIREGKKLKFTDIKQSGPCHTGELRPEHSSAWLQSWWLTFYFSDPSDAEVFKADASLFFLSLSPFSLKNYHFIHSVPETYHFLILQNMRTGRYLRYNNYIMYTLNTRNDNWMTCPRSEEYLSDQTGNRCSDSLASCPTWQHVASLAACSSLCGETISHR